MSEQLIPANSVLPKYDLGDKVLVEALPGPGHHEKAWLPGTIEKKLGLIDLYDGRVSQESVDFPVIQHHYEVSLEEGGIIMNAECRIIPHPHYQR